MTDDREYTAAFDRYEFLRGMLEIAHGQHQSAALGDFVTRADAPAGNLPDADEITDQWPLIAAGAFGRDVASAADAYARLTEQIRQPRSL